MAMLFWQPKRSSYLRSGNKKLSLQLRMSVIFQDLRSLSIGKILFNAPHLVLIFWAQHQQAELQLLRSDSITKILSKREPSGLSSVGILPASESCLRI
ncbi:MAG: hypothetical protein MUC48_24510 [Leptolyngbya sp. Prado105]|nr:hypothetical protein [Leptolyngbya sp. Prado105]